MLAKRVGPLSQHVLFMYVTWCVPYRCTFALDVVISVSFLSPTWFALMSALYLPLDTRPNAHTVQCTFVYSVLHTHTHTHIHTHTHTHAQLTHNELTHGHSHAMHSHVHYIHTHAHRHIFMQMTRPHLHDIYRSAKGISSRRLAGPHEFVK